MFYLFLILSLIELVLMGYDKHQSQVGGWRTSEKVLLGLGIAGGAIGGLIGMRAFRHKTKKTYFWVILGAAALVHLYFLASNYNGIPAQFGIIP
jgi:uncharacterized membrane protein YsdA (DUF1294 family)